MKKLKHTVILILILFVFSSAIAVANTQNTGLNFIVIMLDDQRHNTIEFMESLNSISGISFKNGFTVAVPCCPGRASTSLGQFAYNTGVLANKGKMGGFKAFNDDETLAVWLWRNGYITGLFGKYLNGYDKLYIPPGWNEWFAFMGRPGYRRFTINDNVRKKEFRDFSTELIFNKANEFIVNNKDSPFFALITPYAPHLPAGYQRQDKGKFHDFLHDSPSVRGNRNKINTIAKRQLRSLQSVDRKIEEIFNTLVREGLLDKTVIFVIADSGLMWGEHGIIGEKNTFYEEAIRIPFIIYVPPHLNIESNREDSENFVLNIDIAPTILELAGISIPENWNFDGKSLIPILQEPISEWREEFFFQGPGRTKRGEFFGIRTKNFKLIYFPKKGTYKFFDLVVDPFEMTNQIDNLSYQNEIDRMKLILDGHISKMKFRR